MKKKIFISSSILLSVLLLIMVSCEKQTEPKTVVYEITRSVSSFNVNYLDAKGQLVKETVHVNSAEDIWRYSFQSLPRKVVHVSANYKDINSAINVRILIDGKVYKQASTKYDTTMYVTVSGTVPD